MNARDAFPAVAADPLRVLMVEDDRNDAELIQAYLAEELRAGAVVRHVRTLAEGLEHAGEAQVTLLDLDLPDSSGLATLERMRGATTGPLIVISGNGHPKLEDEALRRRAFDVIPKHKLDAATLRRVMRLAAQHAQSSHAQRASESRYRALVESSSEALVLLDGKGRVEYASAAMRRVLGFESSELLGRYGLEFVQPEDRAGVQGAFGELRGKPGARISLRVRFRHKDGSERVLESTMANRLGESDVAAVVCSYRDLTQEEEQRARFVATFESSAVGLAHVDPDGCILIANQRLCDLLGYSREELVGRTVRELSHPEDIDATAEQRAQLRAGELPQFTARKRYLRKDGEMVWVQLTVSLERDAEGRPKYDIACFEDISEAMRKELAAQRLQHMYAALSATNEVTLKATDAQTLYHRVCELLVEHGGLKLAAVRLVDPVTQWIDTAAYAGEAESYLQGARISIDREHPELQGPTVQTIVEGRTVVSNDYLAEPALRRWHASARAAGIAAMMSVPLRSGGRAIGLLALYAAERGWFDPELVALAERMAENVSFALDNLAREAARRASEERFRALTKMSSDFYWETDAEHRFRLRGAGTRPASQPTFGQDEWIGKTRWELPCLSPDEDGWREHRAALEAHLPIRDFVFSRPCPEVGERFIMISGDPVFDETGAFQGYRGIGTDITEQRIAQKVLELEHAVAAYLATTESEGDGVLGVLRTMCAMFGWQEGRFWRVDERAGLLRFGARWLAAEGRGDMLAAEDGATLRPGEGLAGHVWQSGEPAWVPDVAADPRTSESALAGGVLRSAFLFPLHAEGRTLGVLTFAGDGQRPPNERLRRAAGVIGGQIGLFLQRKRSEAALRESEARFRSLSELSSDYFWETDAEHRLSLRGSGSNPSARSTFVDGGVGKRRWELPYLSPDWQGWMAHKAALDAHQPFRDFVLSRPAADGSERFFSISGEPQFDERGAFLGYRGVGADITERIVAQRILELEHAVAQQLATAENESEGVQGVLRIICSLFNWEQGRFWRADDAAGVLRIGAYWNARSQSSELPAAMQDMEFRPGEGLAGTVWHSGEPLWAPDAKLHPQNSARWLAVAPLRAVFLFPVRAEGKVLGVITCGSDEIRPPNERLLKAVQVIGSEIGSFLQRKRGEEAQRRFRTGMDASADMILLIDPRQMRYVDVNEAVCRALGYTREEMLAMGPQDLLPIPREELQGVYEKFIANPDSIYGMVDSAYRCKDGGLLPFESTRRLLDTEAGPLIVAISRDIRARLQAERTLRESEARFRSLTELSADWYWEQDTELRFVSTGGQDRARGGITAAQHEGLRRWELPGTEPLEGGWDEHQAVLAARKPFRDFMLRRKGNDGSVHYVSVSGEPVFGEDGAFRGYRGVAKDVTDRLRDQDRLRMSHERFEIVSRATNDVVWDWNLETDEIWWNENFRQIYGYAPEEIGRHSDSWTSRIHLEDLARVKSEVEAAIAGRAKSWSGEYRFRRKDGSYADVYDRGLLIHDDRGRAVRMIGAMMDISERKRAESRMRAHAQRQEAVAGFGQFALGRRSPEELYAAAAQALRCAGVDASVAVEMIGDAGEYLIRAAQGEGPHAVVGQRGKLSPDSVWPDIQREHTSRIAGRSYLSSRPAELPWGAWVRTMGSAVYSPVREGERPVGMLCVYAANEHAFGAEDARFVDSVSHVLSTALQRHRAEQRLAHLAQFDALTGLPNRTLLQDRLDQTIVQSRRKHWHAGVLFVDLDRFKLINDSLGHHLGDALIREVGQRLLSSVRPGDTVGRISGDEFAVVLADLARPDDAALVAQKVLDALGQPFDLGGNEAYVTASIGIAAFPEDGEDAETLIKNADMAMYRAKESARNSYCFFTAEMNQRTVAKVQLSADLRRAIERQEFTLHYQPKIALETGELRGMEALLRWNHPTRGMVSPAEFVPALEDSGLILPVGEWVIAEACAQIRQWELAGLAPVPIAVNLSAKQFLRRDLDKTITHALAAAGVPPRLLELEITESCLMHSPEEAIRVLSALRDAGLKISVDDFGTGYSSLAYLARFPLSALKIDRAFVRNVHSDSSAAAIVRAVIDMANNLELQVIAEGVETEQQAAFLRGHGCHQGQGYLFSRPVPADVVGARLHAAR